VALSREFAIHSARRLLTVDAIVFDCDGVLVDSAASVDRSWRRWAAHYGLDGDAVLVDAHGRPSRDTVAAWLPADRVDEACSFIEALELEDAATVGAIGGAFELLSSLPEDRWAVCTSASRTLFDARRAAARLPRPRVLVTADDVVRGKPDPEGYVQALLQLGVRGHRAAVFEDTTSGIKAARAAGITTIIRVGDCGAAAGEAASVSDLWTVYWNGRLTLLP
jgi:sugar-phosphatase